MIVKKFYELNENKSEYNLKYLNKRLLDDNNIIGLIYAFKTDNINKKEAAEIIFEDFENYLDKCGTKLKTNDFINLIELCIDSGADVNKVLRQGYTILMFTMLYGNMDVLEFLIKNGADDLLQNNYGEDIWYLYEKEEDISIDSYPFLKEKYKKWKEIKKFNI